MALYHRQQGDERVVGKVNMPDPLPRLVQDFTESQRDRFETREQALILLARQGGKHAVCDGCSPCDSHGLVLSCPGNGRSGSIARMSPERMYVSPQTRADG